tara:strand:+ start:590 stop:856 length:267 start_codon:yes stop_codon:yes gene_type:complete
MSNIEILENNDGSLNIQDRETKIAYYFSDKRDENTVAHLKLIANGPTDLSEWDGGPRQYYVTDDEYCALSEGGGIRLWGPDDIADAIA